MEFVIFIWLISGVIGSGFMVAHFQRTYPSIAAETYRQDLGLALLLAIAGPIFGIVAFGISGFGESGWQLWRKSNALREPHAENNATNDGEPRT